MNSKLRHGRMRLVSFGAFGRSPPFAVARCGFTPSPFHQVGQTSNNGGNKMLQRIREVKKNQAGFTLIELLIVIVILGVLAAIVVFAVSAFNNNGKAAACKADFKNVEIADEAYFAKATPQAYALTFGTAAAPGNLVPTYLKEAPSTANGYTITLTATGPTVTVGTTTSADASACTALG